MQEQVFEKYTSISLFANRDTNGKFDEAPPS